MINTYDTAVLTPAHAQWLSFLDCVRTVDVLSLRLATDYSFSEYVVGLNGVFWT